MAKRFSYKAIHPNNGFVKGTLRADDINDLLYMLRQEKLLVISIREYKESPFLKIFGIRWRGKEIAVFCKQVATLLEAGIDPVRAIRLVSISHKGKRKQVLEDVAIAIEKGSSLAVALKNEANFPDLAVHLVHAGEESGTLAENLKFAAEHYKEEERLRREWEDALTYPLVVLLLATAVLGLTVFLILPVFAEFFTELGIMPSAETMFVLNLSLYIHEIWKPLLAIIIFGLTLLIYFLSTSKGQDLKAGAAEHIHIIRCRTYMRVCRILSLLLASGISFGKALHMAAEVGDNSVLRRRLFAAEERILAGTEPTKALRLQGIDEALFLHMLEIGMESGRMTEMLQETANLYEEEAKYLIEKYRLWLGPTILLVVGIVVAFLIFGIMVPMLEAITAPIH